MHIRVKKLDPKAVLPKRANESRLGQGDAGYDVVAIDNGTWNEDGTYIEYNTGISIEPPPGYHTEMFPRSSITKYDLVLGNSIGLVDNPYRGPIKFRFKYVPRVGCDAQGVPCAIAPIKIYCAGDKIGQLVIRKTENMDFVEAEELSDTTRGTGCFGSSGK